MLCWTLSLDSHIEVIASSDNEQEPRFIFAHKSKEDRTHSDLRTGSSQHRVWDRAVINERQVPLCPVSSLPLYWRDLSDQTHCHIKVLKQKVKVTQSCPTLCDPNGLYSPWNSPGQNTGVGSLFFLEGIFPTQGLQQVSNITGIFFTSWATREAQESWTTSRTSVHSASGTLSDLNSWIY